MIHFTRLPGRQIGQKTPREALRAVGSPSATMSGPNYAPWSITPHNLILATTRPSCFRGSGFIPSSRAGVDHRGKRFPGPSAGAYGRVDASASRVTKASNTPSITMAREQADIAPAAPKSLVEDAQRPQSRSAVVIEVKLSFSPPHSAITP